MCNLEQVNERRTQESVGKVNLTSKFVQVGQLHYTSNYAASFVNLLSLIFTVDFFISIGTLNFYHSYIYIYIYRYICISIYY